MATTTVKYASITSILPDTNIAGDFITSDNGTLGGPLTFKGDVQMNAGTLLTTLKVYLHPSIYPDTDSTHDILVGSVNLAQSNTKFVISYSGVIPDGTYSVVMKNGANTIAAIPNEPQPTIVIDTTAPLAPVVTFVDTANPDIAGTTTDTITRNATLSGASGTGEKGDTVKIYESGSQIGATTVLDDGTWSFTPTNPSQGTHTYSVTLTDKAGNVSAAGSTTLVFDSVGPTIFTLNALAPDAGAITDGRTMATGLTISGTTEAGATVTIFDGEAPLTTVTANAQGAWTYHVTGLANESSHTFSAQAKDSAGNVSATLSAQAVTIDTSAPTLTIDALTANADNVLNSAESQGTLQISGATNAEDGQHVTVGLNGKTYDATVSAGGWHVDVSNADLGDLADAGAYPVTASVNDIAGNTGNATPVTLSVDISAPTLTIDPITGDSLLNASEAGAGIVITGSTNAESGQHVTVTLNNQTYDAVVAGGHWQTDTIAASALAALTDGSSNSVTASVSDAAGNPATATPVSLTVDETATISVTSVAGDGLINDLENYSGGFDVVGTTTGVEDGREVTVTVNGSEPSEAVMVLDGHWTAHFDGLGADEGEVSVEATVQDAAGNTATDDAATATVDTLPPTIVIGKGLAGDYTINIAEID